MTSHMTKTPTESSLLGLLCLIADTGHASSNSNAIFVCFEQDWRSTQVEVQFAPIKRKAQTH